LIFNKKGSVISNRISDGDDYSNNDEEFTDLQIKKMDVE